MALNIKNTRVEQLAAELARITGESKTEAILRALEDRRARLSFKASSEDRLTRMRECLEREVWPQIPAHIRGKKMTKRERERILGIGPLGYPE